MFEEVDKLINDSGLAGLVAAASLFIAIVTIRLIKKTKTYQKFLNDSINKSL